MMHAGTAFQPTEENMSKNILSDIYWPVRCSRRSAKGTEGRCLYVLQALTADLKQRKRSRSMPGVQAIRRNVEPVDKAKLVPMDSRQHTESRLVGVMREERNKFVEVASAFVRDRGVVLGPPCTLAPTVTLALSPMIATATESGSVATSSKRNGDESWKKKLTTAVLPVPVAITRESTLEAKKEGAVAVESQLPAAVAQLPDGGETCTPPGSLSGNDEQSSEEEEAGRCPPAISTSHPGLEDQQPVSRTVTLNHGDMKTLLHSSDDKGYCYQEEDMEVKPTGGLFSCTACNCVHACV